MINHIISKSISLVIIFAIQSFAQDFSFLATAQMKSILSSRNESSQVINVRYAPHLTYSMPFNSILIKTEFIYDMSFFASFDEYLSVTTQHTLKPYRASMLIQADQYMVGLGLQHIRFGSGRILRPLMWFDQTNPSDPLALVEGVDAIQAKFYLPKNMMIQSWVIVEDQVKGNEFFPSDPKHLELGGLFQGNTSLFEASIIAHTRSFIMYEESFKESRIGFDISADVIVGLWAEVMFKKQDSPYLLFPYSQQMMLGMDYSLAYGNGIQIMGETMSVSSGTSFSAPKSFDLFAFQLSYPISFLDSFSLLSSFYKTNQNFTHYLIFTRTLDYFSFSLTGGFQHLRSNFSVNSMKESSQVFGTIQYSY
jgi:hypothetical protein